MCILGHDMSRQTRNIVPVIVPATGADTGVDSRIARDGTAGDRF